MRRSELREHIFRMVFGLDFNEGEEIPEQIQLYFEQLDDVKERDMEYIREKAEHIAEKREEIDALLNTHTKGWKTSRMNKVDLSILRVAVYEMKWDDEVPVGVAIDQAVELAKKYNVNLVVRSSMTDAEGTIVKEEVKVEKMLVSGVAVDKDVARIAIVGLKDEPGVAFKIFSLLSKEKISVDIIIQSIGRSNTKDISFTVAEGDCDEALRILNEHKERLGFEDVTANKAVAKVSVVGAGMATNSGVASMLFEATFDAGINVKMISTSEIKISILVKDSDADRAAIAIHDKFMSESINARQ
mgnify:CR=1 FL=1